MDIQKLRIELEETLVNEVIEDLNSESTAFHITPEMGNAIKLHSKAAAEKILAKVVNYKRFYDEQEQLWLEQDARSEQLYQELQSVKGMANDLVVCSHLRAPDEKIGDQADK